MNAHRFWILAALLIAAGDASAYIDPNTGGFLYQLFLPVILSIAVLRRHIQAFLKEFLQKIRSFFQRK